MKKDVLKKKSGITLIALVITIIVLLILAGVSIATLTGESGLLNKVEVARNENEIQQIKEQAELVKLEAIIEYSSEGKTLTQNELVDLINKDFTGSSKSGNNIITKDGKYQITVDEKLNISIEEAGVESEIPQLNEYGFYYEQLYAVRSETLNQGFVFHEDGSLEIYSDYDLDGDLFCKSVFESGVTYEEKKITLLQSDGTELVGTVSDDGLSMVGQMGTNTITLTCTFEELHGMYIGETYEFTMAEDSGEVYASMRLDSNNILTIYTLVTIEGETQEQNNTFNARLDGDGHVIVGFDEQGEGNIGFVSTDGRSIYSDGVVFTIVETDTDTEILEGAIITPVEGSSVENIMAGKPMTGDTVEYDGYIYKYNQAYFYSDWVNTAETQGTEFGELMALKMNSWGVKVKDNTLTAYPDMLSTVYNIPVKNLSYTFEGCENLETMPKLSNEASTLFYTFMNCKKLTTCDNLPVSLKTMNYTFTNCIVLSSIVIPENVTNLIYTFDGCIALENVSILPSVVNSMSGIFEGCTNLVNVQDMPDNVTDMSYTFKDCSKFEGLSNLPSGVTNMNGTFQGCLALLSVPDIPETVTAMTYTFRDCKLIEKAPIIPSLVTELDSTFEGCESLKTVQNIPSNVTSMSNTFDGCKLLETVPAIPEKVTDMYQTFYDCESLKGTITINAQNLEDYSYCFTGTVLPIELIGDCPLEVRQAIAETGYSNNVTAK